MRTAVLALVATASLLAAAALLLAGPADEFAPTTILASKCDAACVADKKAKAKAVAAQMAALRKQIMGDFSATTKYGHEVGKIPAKSESIRDQVMDGSLVGQKKSADPPPPPPFNPSLKISPSALHKSIRNKKSSLKKASAAAKIKRKQARAVQAAKAAKAKAAKAAEEKAVNRAVVKKADKAIAKAVAKVQEAKKKPAQKVIVQKTAVGRRHESFAQKNGVPSLNAKKLAFSLGNLVKRLKHADNIHTEEHEKKKTAKTAIPEGNFLRGFFGQ
mmetsp:Transcript_130356/g.193985  ORF Transcript_130356/g.193985 Transcript_130356/m.193985 type:complete len:274 (+) Transcript_130356:1-822(+)|eukprot:CAMPEP_0117025518 /NCGR_PEP_ID=MMETSP0472-20121206/18840_1 /TAXON_ID=693140 ORGANISM="Tiarina fusus, Strain LIS" /NCGR_SAMPLE_ID=MMETSP0472 /ASSEMBLY_ACC=CAM_ASM_000603 /LENGTH=273 /DNA_ID=CAMNT_0004732251 /DNA_START=1 /DNA_END=822 /DNA_ORIENTATION=+